MLISWGCFLFIIAFTRLVSSVCNFAIILEFRYQAVT